MAETILLGILDSVELKHRLLLLVSIPVVLSILSPSEDDGLHVELPVRPHERSFRFLPDQCRSDPETGILEGIVEHPGLHCCVELIEG